jgi:hypothetical protein
MADRRCTGCVCGLAFGEMGDALHLCTESQVGAFVESHVPEPVIFFSILSILYTLLPKTFLLTYRGEL